MNFLAHYALIRPDQPAPARVLGNALPDLLPLAAPHARFRPRTLHSAQESLLREGVGIHLVADAAFHRAPAFAWAMAEMKRLLRDADFRNMRLRLFFLAHVLAELSLDAALLRADPGLADAFYAALADASIEEAVRWTESTLQQPIPLLPGVLTNFQRSRYLEDYRTDAGVAEGLSQLCARVRQETFTGENFPRLMAVVSQAVPILDTLTPALFTQTRPAL